MNILSIDVGTTSMRGFLFGPDAQVAAAESVSMPLLFSGKNGEYVEQLPERFLDGVLQICRAIAEGHRVDAISITAFRSAVALVDEQGRALCNFIMWQDTRNREICRRYEPHSGLIFRKSGAQINTVFTATKICWLAENQPRLYARAHKVVTVPDYIIHQMTGVLATDRTYGSRTHLMNIKTLEWDDELCGLFGIDKKLLCPLIDQGTVAGRVEAAFAQATGIPAGTPVISAGGDQQCGALGLGVLDGSSLEVNSGTGSFVISLADEPYLENTSVICNVSALRGKYIIESNILSSASALNWLIREFFPEHWGDTPDFAAMDAMVQAVAAGANGVYCIPHFQGCGTRSWNPGCRAAFWGLSLNNTRQDMARALYEGLAVEIAKSVDALPGHCRKARRVYVAGGLSKSDVYNQILSDALGREISRYADPQATAIGAFASAAAELGVYPSHAAALAAVREKSGSRQYTPNPHNTALYQENKRVTERLYRFGLV